MNKEKWHQSWFNEDYLDLYHEHGEKRAELEVEFLLNEFPELPQWRVLDLACGKGRHCKALAKKGSRVTGIDYSDVMLKKAKEETKALPISYQKVDLRELPQVGSFDLVISMFTSFGYFNHSENKRSIALIAKNLRPKGLFFLDFLDVNQVKAQLVEEETKIIKNQKVKITRQIIGKHVVKSIFFPHKKYIEKVQLYTNNELQKMAQQAGFQLFKSWQCYPHDPQTPRQLLLFAKI